MNIGGLLTRSFGTGPFVMNRAEQEALASMRDRQAFRDEEEARRRRAALEDLAIGVGLPNAPQMGTFGEGTKVEVPPPPPPPPPPSPATGVNIPAMPPSTAPTAPAVGIADPTTLRWQNEQYNNAISNTTNQLNAAKTELQNHLKTRPIYTERGTNAESIAWNRKTRELQQKVSGLTTLRDRYIEGRAQLAKPQVVPATKPPSTAGMLPSGTNIAQFSRFANAVMMAESGGKPDAVSPKGALGRMQVMPETLKSPGYGITPARNNSDAEITRVGTEYLSAMLREFGGNSTYALAAYNWGPGNVKQWIAKGANIADLPQETQDYIQRVSRFYIKTVGGATPAEPVSLTPGAVANAPAQLGATTAAASNAYVPPTEQASVSDYSNAVPRVDYEFNQQVQLREELVRQAMAAQEQYLPDLYTQTVSQIRDLDKKLVFLQGMLGLGDLVDNPMATQRLSEVMSYYRGQKPGYYVLQPRSDGKYNVVVNGRQTQAGLSLQQVIDNTRMIFDEAYAASVYETRALRSKTAIESEAKLNELAAAAGYKLQELAFINQNEIFKQSLKDTAEYKRAIDVARETNRGKIPEPKFFNATDPTGATVTIMSIGNSLFQFTGQFDTQGNPIAGTLRLAPILGAAQIQ